MQKQDIETILASQRKFFATGKTLPVSWRLEQLKKLRTSMLRHEEDLYGALKKDLGKSRMESYMCEIGLTLSELTWMEKHIRRLTRENGFQPHWHSSLQEVFSPRHRTARF